MKLKVWIKSRAADRVLAPLRKELVELIDQDASLLEIGCGTGDLILQSAAKISCAFGIDLDKDLVDYAEEKRKEKGLSHISFECINALELTASKYDIATSTLCLHELTEQDACGLLEMMVNNSRKIIIADYSEAKTLSGKLGIEIDELFSGHYGNFRQYRLKGGIPTYVSRVDATIDRVIASTIDGISIWLINGRARNSLGKL